MFAAMKPEAIRMMADGSCVAAAPAGRDVSSCEVMVDLLSVTSIAKAANAEMLISKRGSRNPVNRGFRSKTIPAFWGCSRPAMPAYDRQL
jgi:hypothetical protein